MLLSMNLTY